MTPFTPSRCRRPTAFDLLGCGLVEPLHEHVANLVVEHDRVRHGRDVDDLASEVHLDRLGHAGPIELYRHLGAGLADEVVGDLLGGPAARGQRIDVDDPVAFAHATRFSRRVREDGGHGDGALLIEDLHADSGILAVGLLRETGELLGREQFAVRVVELLHHSSSGPLVQRGLSNRVHIALGHEGEDLIEQLGAIGRRTILNEKAAGNGGKESERDDSGAATEHDQACW